MLLSKTPTPRQKPRQTANEAQYRCPELFNTIMMIRSNERPRIEIYIGYMAEVDFSGVVS